MVTTIQNAGGHYGWARASLTTADCSGLVSVAQSLATGRPVGRLGDTRTLMAGRWPNAIPGASQEDAFVIGGNSGHMVARINGVGIEARTAGQPWVIGPDAASPWSPGMRQWHVDPAVLVLA